MLILAFDRVLSAMARERICQAVEHARAENKILVLEECRVLSENYTDSAAVNLSDGSVIIIPHGLSRSELEEKIRGTE